MKVRTRCMVGLMLVVALLGGVTVSGIAADGQVLTFLIRNIPRGLDPAIITGWSIRSIDPVYEALLGYESDTGAIIPKLAESWEVSQDGLTYTFHLQQGVMFHDGTELTAETVKANIERVLAIGTGPATVLGPVTEVQVIDNYEVDILLDSTYPDFLHALTQLYLVSQVAVTEHGTDEDPWAMEWFRDNMTGTGPYKLEAWDATSEQVLVKNEDYWQGARPDGVDIIRFFVVLEVATQRMMLLSGEAQIIDQVAVEDIATMEADPDFNVQVIPEMGMFYLHMRSDTGPLSDARTRLALTYAFPWEDYLEGAMNGVYPQAQGPIPRGMTVHEEAIPVYKQDLERSAELFALAGVNPETLSLTLRIVEKWTPMVRAAEIFQYALSQLGISLEIQELNWSTLCAQARNEQEAADMSFVSVGAKMPSPTLLLKDAFHSSSRGTAYNWGWYSNPTLDALLDEASSVLDEDRRATLYQQAQLILFADAPAIFVMENSAMFSMSSKVKGYVANLSTPYVINFFDITLDD
ncbi:ABC transporter substrate-binding protein [Candidatus Bipolaricaulota bacterium]